MNDTAFSFVRIIYCLNKASVEPEWFVNLQFEYMWREKCPNQSLNCNQRKDALIQIPYLTNCNWK